MDTSRSLPSPLSAAVGLFENLLPPPLPHNFATLSPFSYASIYYSTSVSFLRFLPSSFIHFSPERSSVLHYPQPFSHAATLPFYTLGTVPWLWRCTGRRGDTGPARKEFVFRCEATPVTQPCQGGLLGPRVDALTGPPGAGIAARVHPGWPRACFAGELFELSLGGWRGSCGPRRADRGEEAEVRAAMPRLS